MDGHTNCRPATSLGVDACVAQRFAAGCRTSPPQDGEFAAFTLDSRCAIEAFGPAAERLFGYCPRDVIGRHVSKLLPKLAQIDPLRGDRINPQLAFLAQCGVVFKAIPQQGASFACHLYFHETGGDDAVLRVMVQRVAAPAVEYP